jgi:hypothetical protein
MQGSERCHRYSGDLDINNLNLIRYFNSESQSHEELIRLVAASAMLMI